MRGKIEKVERSKNHQDLRWLTINGKLYSLWDSVNDQELKVNQEVEFEARELPGRDFLKITKIKPLKRKKREKKTKAQSQSNLDFSKTEIGLMISVAVKAAAQMSSSPEELIKKQRQSTVISKQKDSQSLKKRAKEVFLGALLKEPLLLWKEGSKRGSFTFVLS